MTKIWSSSAKDWRQRSSSKRLESVLGLPLVQTPERSSVAQEQPVQSEVALVILLLLHL